MVPWSSLAGGFPSGEYDRENTADTGRLSGASLFGSGKFVDRNLEILNALKAVTEEVERSLAQVALAWTLAHPGVASTPIGASKTS